MKIKSVAIIYFWEFLQNLPALACLLVAAAWWPKPWTFVLIAMGGLGSALVIAWTEHYKDPGYREPFRMLATNAVGFSIMICLIVIFLTWSHGWFLDPPIGLLCGVAVACVQNLVQNKRVSVRHVLAIGLGSAAALTLIVAIGRSGMALPFKALIVNSIATAIIVVVDYVIGLGDPNMSS